jgi:transposase
VTGEEWAFMAPYLTLLDPQAPQRRHDLREVFNALRWLVRTGAQRRMLPAKFPPWPAVYHYCRLWRRDGTWTIHTALRERVWVADGREPNAECRDPRQPVGQDDRKRGAGGYDAAKPRLERVMDLP